MNPDRPVKKLLPIQNKARCGKFHSDPKKCPWGDTGSSGLLKSKHKGKGKELLMQVQHDKQCSLEDASGKSSFSQGINRAGLETACSGYLALFCYTAKIFFLLITLTVCPHPAKGGRVAHTETLTFFPGILNLECSITKIEKTNKTCWCPFIALIEF